MKRIAFSILLVPLALAGCVQVDVKPIHITMDINIRVDRQLDEFFAFEQKYTSPTTQPATQTTSINNADGGRS